MYDDEIMLTDDDANDDSTPENDVSAPDVDANDANATCNISGENVTHDSREKINALRAHYGAGPTAMTDEQIEAGCEVYGAKKDADMVIVDELQDSREKLEADVRKFVYSKGWFDDGIEPDSKPYIMELFIEWLNRQAAITKSECANTNAQRLGELHDLLDEAARERKKLREELTEWKHSHPLTLNQPDSKSVAPKPAETAENDAAKDDIRDFADSREKLEADVRYRSIRPTTKIDCHYDDVLRWLDRQAAIDRKEFQTILEEIQKCMRNGNR